MWQAVLEHIPNQQIPDHSYHKGPRTKLNGTEICMSIELMLLAQPRNMMRCKQRIRSMRGYRLQDRHRSYS